MAFCGISYFEIIGSRTYQILTKVDFLASLLPLICIPTILSLGAGLFKWKDDNWKLSRGAYMFIIIGLLLLIGAISAIIVTIKPREIGAAFLLVLLLLVLAIGVIHYWASNNFYLTRIQMLLVCFLAFLLALAAFLVGWFHDDWIPCDSPGKPAFSTSRKDLTGGAGEEIDMRSDEAQIDLVSGRLWSQLLHFKQEGVLLGAGSPSGSDVHISSSGIVQGHAYSILQIRNPWANKVEWNGPWSDPSPAWTDRMKHKLKHVPQVELDSRTRRLETEKNELQSVLKKKLDRRSSDWSLKLEKYQIEQHRLRERARDLAKQNVSQQREVFSFNEKEVDNRIKISFLEKHLEDLSNRIEQVSEENQNLRQQLTQLQEEYRVAQDNRDYIRENYQEKVKELKSETFLTTLLREKLYSEEMDIKQLQVDLAATVRGNDILKCEVRNVLDALYCATPKLKYLEL
ncbi:Calpain-type cysteine protease DEK1 [Capsicum chinense]|nr:Calpain-type cysteine protease DEK1 [Capsicum chinense]